MSSTKVPVWADSRILDAALQMPCPWCKAERGQRCANGSVHAARAKRGILPAGVREDAKRRIDEWNAMSEEQKSERCRGVLASIGLAT